ncbi:nucleoporin NDC1-like [Babylonia areolata]|uniref:nucleoporin NDC1-like n=1 Tax=Babylonia areolata TaxID=304850 RepID=UPI003FD5882B
MDSVTYWYKSEVHFWRTSGSLFWSVSCFPPVTVLFVLLSQISLLQPWMGLTDFLSVTCTFSFVLWLCVLVAVLVAVACTTTFTVVPDVPSTRLESYLSLLRLSRLPHMAVSTLGGACVAWCLSHLVGERFYGLTALVTTAGREVLVLNESHLFYVLAGSLAGLVYYCNFYLNHRNYLVFPALQRDKYFRVRNDVVQMAKQCLHLVRRHLQILIVGYWTLGFTYRSWVMGALSVDAIRDQPLNRVSILVDVGLLWQTALCSFFIVFTWGLMAVLYRVYHTQRLEIPVLSTFGADSKHSLTEALNSQSADILQYLAFLDLSHLSRCSPQRRQEMFSLSQPGGHPHTWRGVCGTCLQQLEGLAAQVNAAHQSALAALPVHSLPADKIFSFAGETPLTQRGLSHSFAQSPGVENLPLHPPAPPAAPPANKQSLASMVYSGLKTKPILSYFLMELPDSKSRQLFASCQVHIWAIEAISELAAASYEEDKYGVVQMTLSAIFTTLVSLHDNLEKYFKLQPTALRRGGKDSQPPPHVILCQQLREGLKTAIYRLTNRFGKHLGDFHLKVDCSKRLRPFLDFKE